MTRSPANPTPTSTAQTGSVPNNKLTRAGEVRRTAHICTTNANTVHARARKPVSIQSAGDIAAANVAAGHPNTWAKPAEITATESNWTNVARAESSCRRAETRAMTVTCTARNSAAAATSVSPTPGRENPPDWVSSTQPTTATAPAP